MSSRLVGVAFLVHPTFIVLVGLALVGEALSVLLVVLAFMVALYQIVSVSNL
jgi:hypothetical protein